jgi:hypothetical protein
MAVKKIRPPSEYVTLEVVASDVIVDMIVKGTGMTKAQAMGGLKNVVLPKVRAKYTADLKKEVQLTVASQTKVLKTWKKEGYPEGAWKK